MKTYSVEDVKNTQIGPEDNETLFLHFTVPQYLDVKDLTEDNIEEAVQLASLKGIENGVYHTTVTKQFEQQKKLISLLDHYYKKTGQDNKTFERFKEYFLPVFNELGYTKSMQSDNKPLQEVRYAPAFIEKLINIATLKDINKVQLNTVLEVEQYSAGYAAGTKTALSYYIVDNQLIIPMIAFSGICLTFPITQGIKDLLIQETKKMDSEVFSELQKMVF